MILKITKYIVKIVYRKSRWFVAPIIRGVYMLVDLLNPLFYFSSLRIKSKSSGLLKFNNKKTAIFVLYQNDKIPFYVQNILDVFERLEVNCVISVNDGFSPENIRQLKKQCSKLFIRRNFGFDFTAYKDIISHLDLKNQERLVLMNDTLFYFKKDLDKLFVQLFDEKYDVIAFGKNSFDQAPHLQSFLLSFSNRVIIDKDFISYWKNYKPFNNGVYVVHNGEMALTTKVLGKYCDSTKVIYNLEFLMKSLEKIPLSTRTLFTSKVRAISSQDHVNFNYTVLDYKRVFRYLQETNTTHGAAFLVAHSGFGVHIKRDLVYRVIFSLEQVRQNLEKLHLDKNEKNEALRELESRGVCFEDKIQKRFLCAFGVR